MFLDLEFCGCGQLVKKLNFPFSRLSFHSSQTIGCKEGGIDKLVEGTAVPGRDLKTTTFTYRLELTAPAPPLTKLKCELVGTTAFHRDGTF